MNLTAETIICMKYALDIIEAFETKEQAVSYLEQQIEEPEA